VVEAILEMADDQLRSGLIDKAEHEKITIRHMGSRGLGIPLPSPQIAILSTSSSDISSCRRS
jgi:hypothetical protein